MKQEEQRFRNKSAQIFTEWLPLIENLSDTEAGKMFKNILNYQNGDDIKSSNPVWFFILNKLEDYNGNYEEIRGKRIKAGRLGGQAKASKCQQVLTKPSKSTNKTKQNPTKQNKATKEFIIPSLLEVKEYAISRGREDLAKEFYDFFDVGDWIDSNDKPVKNWRRKFITWEGFNKKPLESSWNPEEDELYLKALESSK